jgi:hypothetical protein
MGLTIHFDREAPEELEQWLSTEARYVIGTFGKIGDLHKVCGDRAEAIMSECKRLGEKIISGITMILDGDRQKLRYIKVRLQNGDAFLIDSKYAPISSSDTSSLIEAMILEDGPEVISVSNK